MGDIKVYDNDDFILYNEKGNVILTGVNTGVNNIYSISKPFPLKGDDLAYAKCIVKEHFNNSILVLFLSTYTADNEIYVHLTNSFWRNCEIINANISVDIALQIIDDALTHGFEFKVENGNVYFREIMNKI